MECTTCQKRKENQKLASRNYYIRNSDKIINKTLIRRYLKKKRNERGEQSGDRDEGDSGEEDTSDRDEGDSGEGDSDSDTSDSGEGGSEGKTEKKK